MIDYKDTTKYIKYSILDMKEWDKPNQIRLMKQVMPAIHESLAIYSKRSKQVTISKINLLDGEDLANILIFIGEMKLRYD